MRFAVVVLLASIFLFNDGFSQLGPLSGSQPKSFSTVPDNLGFLENSINAFTGQVQFSLPLSSVSSQGNLSYPVSIGYSSANMENQVSTWNREAPTSVLGLGWSMDAPRIVADHKNTGTRKDDEFFLLESGASTQLLCTSNAGYFYTARFSNWIIYYNEVSELWTITKEDGTIFTYGDKNSGRKTVRYMVNWGNWIGNSSQPLNQAQMAYTWDLAEVKDTWGNKLLLEYQQAEEYVAGGNGAAITTEKLHTKASYLKEVRNTYNEKITFLYTSKQAAEYKDPHNERPEPDAYQEKYETLTLDKIQNYIDGNLASEVRFGYSSIGTGELTKRILTSVTPYSRAGNAQPGFLFSYELLTGANYGALKQVTSPLKGTATFSYTKVTLDRTNLSYTVPAVTNFTEPQIYFGNDYIVITRRDATGGHNKEARQMRVDILTWDGGVWVQWSGTSIPSVTLKEFTKLCDEFGNNCVYYPPFRQEYKITLGKDFFAILPNLSSAIYLFKKDENKTGQWFFDGNQVVPSTANASLLSGTDFIFMGAKEGSIGNDYSFNWINGQWIKTTLANKGAGTSQYFYTVANNYILTHEDVVGTASDRIKIYYKQPSNSVWYSTGWQQIPGTYGDSYWHGSNSYAVMMAASGNERIYKWDENYAISGIDLGVAVPDYSFVNNISNSMVFMTAVDAPVRGLAWRYDGINWNSSGTIDFYGPDINLRNLFSLGEDYVLRPRPSGNTAMRSYDPATRAWTSPLALDIPTTNPYVLLAGHNYFTTSGKFYFKNIDAVDSWSMDTQNISSLAGNTSDFYLQGGIDFVATGIFGLNSSMAVRFKNGSLFPSPTLQLSGLIKDRTNVLFAPAQIGYNVVVTGLGNVANMEDASSLQIYRRVGNSFQGSISAFVATQIEMNDGTTLPTQVTYDYYTPTAAIDASGSIPQFNRVRTYQGINLNNGYSHSYFYNGLDPSTLFAIDPSAVNGLTNTFANHKFVTGSPYKSTVYNNLGNIITNSWTALQFEYRGLNNRSYSILPYASTQYQDNQLIETSINYTPFASVRTNTIKGKSTSAQYFNEWYTTTPFSAYNIFAPVREETTNNGQTLSVSVSRWKNFGGFIAPYQSYRWKSGSTDFSAYWDAATTVPSANWRLTNTNISYNNRGLLTESIDGNNVFKSTIYHPTKPLVLATITKAMLNQVVYEGFEYVTSNTSAEALTGLKSYSASFNVTLPSAGNFQLTYWRKVGAANWEFISQTISSNLMIGGAGILIDEVRLFPAGAIVNSFAYDQWGNLITTCDSNNLVSYFEYDELNRQKMVRDESKNILSYKNYNIKN
ncbi:MAG: hypothetical protein ACK5RG_10015 [Cyclobacteriaceae bacterium]|jgi:hypothetical protein